VRRSTPQDDNSRAKVQNVPGDSWDVSCSPAVAADFDRALALLHNFWYVRAFERFNQVLKNDPGWQGRTVAREQFQALFRFEVMFVNT